MSCVNAFREKAEKLCFLINIKADYTRDMKETKTWNKKINRMLFTNYIRIPIIKNTKIAAVKGWNKLTKSANINKNNDVAYKTGKEAGFFVLDIDNPKKTDKDGYKKWLELKRKYNVNTKTVQTKNNGLHLYFKYDDDLKQTTKINGYSIDIRSDGGYVMSPESDGYTTVNHAEISTISFELKKWIMAHYDKPTCKKTNKIPKINKNYIHLYDKDELKTVLNGLDKKYLNNRSDWLKVTSILKSENLYDLWNNWSIKSPVYDKVGNDKIWESLSPELDMMYINQISKTQLKVNRTMKLNLLTKKPTETRNEKFINLDNFDYMNNRVLLIKSGTGTGKTFNSVKLIDKIRKVHHRKILSIVSRKSLAKQHQTNFNNTAEKLLIKLNYYETMSPDDMNACDELVIQIDSLWKLDWKKWRSCILYLDETNSMLDFLLTSTTLRTKRMDVWQTFNFIVKECGYLIGVDADMSDNVLNYFDELQMPTYLIHNTYMNCVNRPAVHYSDKDKLIVNMKKKMKKGEHFIFCSDSLSEQKLIIEYLKQYCEEKNLNCKSDFLVYSSEEGDDNTLINITDNWKNRYVFYSPKIVYGLDFNNKDPIDVFFLGKSTSVNPLQFSQMIARTRNIKKLHYYIQERNHTLEFESVSDVKDHYEYMINYYDKTIDKCDNYDKNYDASSDAIKLNQIKSMKYLEIDNRTGEIVFNNTMFEKLYYQNEYYDHVMRTAMTYHFEEILKQKGYVITQNNKKAKHKIDVKKLKEDVENNFDVKVERILNDKNESLSDSEKMIKEQNPKRRYG